MYCLHKVRALVLGAMKLEAAEDGAETGQLLHPVGHGRLWHEDQVRAFDVLKLATKRIIGQS